MNSMTGFGRASGTVAGSEVTVEVSAVNKRALEVATSLPREWSALERPLQQAVREHFTRGRFHLAVRQASSGTGGSPAWDETALDATIDRLKETAHRHGIVFELTTDTLAQLALEHTSDAPAADLENLEAELLQVVREAFTETATMRAREGQALRTDLASRLQTIAEARQRIAELSANAVDEYREALLSRLRQSGLELDLDDDRVLKEIALFADRVDISEELTRLDSHLDHFRELLEATDAVGRRLDFLVQEFMREANTIGSKTPNSDVSRTVIELKNELERIREQVQNVE